MLAALCTMIAFSPPQRVSQQWGPGLGSRYAAVVRSTPPSIAIVPPVPSTLPVGLILSPPVGGFAGSQLAHVLPSAISLPLAAVIFPIFIVIAAPFLVSFCQRLLFAFAGGILRVAHKLEQLRCDVNEELLQTMQVFGLSGAPAIAPTEPPRWRPQSATKKQISAGACARGPRTSRPAPAPALSHPLAHSIPR